MNCIGYHITVEGIIANSDGGFAKESPYLDFLLQPKPDAIKVFYHLNHAVACLCRTLGFTEEQCRKLHDKGSLHLPPYDLKYVPAKFFSVRSNIVQSNGDRPFANFSDMSQYFEWSLDGKCDLSDCTARAYTAKDVGERVLDAAHKLGLKPTALTSPIRMFEKEILGKYDEKGRAKPKGIDFPVVADLPDDVKEDLADYAYRCCHGGWNDCFIKGHFDAWDYDINCYPKETEVLTRVGWLPIGEAVVGQNILTFDKDRNTCSFAPIRAMHEHFYRGELVFFQSRHMSLAVTPNHRVICKRFRGRIPNRYFTKEWEVIEAAKMPRIDIQFPVSFPIEEKEDYPISDAILKILAQTGRKYQLSIYQSELANPSKCREIEQTLEEAGIRYTIRHCNNNCNAYVLPAKYSRWYVRELLEDNIHLISIWILTHCSHRQLLIYFDTLIKGDGYDRGTSKRFITCLNENADRMMYLCHLLGYRSYKSDYLSHGHEMHTVYITTKNTEDVRCKPKAVAYEGLVFCPTVDSGFIVVRQQGKSCISGNSAYPHYMSHLLDWRYGEWHETDEYVQSPFYSFWKGEVEMAANFHPIIWSQTYDMGYTPTGRWPCHVTGLEVEFIRKYGLGEFHCEHGFYWLPHTQVRPFKTTMVWLWNAKERSEGLDRDFAKRCGSGVWGKSGEVRHDGTMGAHFEPVMHAWVEAQTRLEVARFVLDNDLTEHVLSIAVDGVLTDCPVGLSA